MYFIENSHKSKQSFFLFLITFFIAQCTCDIFDYIKAVLLNCMTSRKLIVFILTLNDRFKKLYIILHEHVALI